MNWFERHPNWTAGIFGHLLVFILSLLYWAPIGALAPQNLINIWADRLAPFRTPEFAFYHSVFSATYFVLVFSLYLGMNIWYIRMKRLSYKYLGWLGLILIPSCLVLIFHLVKIDTLFHSTNIILAVGLTIYFMFPVAFILSAIMMLRLKSKNLRT
jgi:hypothetical protein